MTAAQRTRIRVEAARLQRQRHLRRIHPINPAVYLRVLAACCLDSPVDVEEHAERIALVVAHARQVREAAA